MKTVVIWDTIEDAIRFFVLNGDFTRLDGVYINQCQDKELESELAAIVYDKDGNEKIKMLGHFPTNEIKKDTAVIACGFLP